MPVKHLSWNSYWTMTSLSISIFGIIITLAITIIFLCYNSAPIIRASGRELSYILLFGTFLCHCVTFCMLLKPNVIVCGTQEFLMGISFTVVYGALLTKTNRISRIFNSTIRSARRPQFISPRSQLLICFGIILIQVFINGTWLIKEPSKSLRYYPSRTETLEICKVHSLNIY